MPSGRGQESVRWRLAAGGLAAALALAFDWGLHRAVVDVPFVPFALADRIVRLTPGSIATWMIDHLHHAAKALLAGGCVVALIAAGALISVAARRRAPVTGLAFGVLVLAAGALEPVQPSLWAAALGAAVGGAGYGLTAAALTTLSRAGSSPWWRPLDLDRRRALTRLGQIALAGAALNALAPLVGTGGSVRLLEFARTPRRRRPRFPQIAGLTPEVTSVADHYIVDIDIDKPIVDAPSWRLRVDGLVSRPLALGFDDLQERFRLVSEYAMLTCISNQVGGRLVGNSLWEGARLRDLLDAADASDGAWGLAVSCADGYTAGIPLAAARHPASIAAIAQDGQPLTREHGFPCRLRVPALYGMLNPKWVTEIRVVGRAFLGYWAQQGWSRTAVVRTEARIDTPSSARTAEPTWIAGVAWAGIRGIAGVDVSTDGGRTWQAALLHQPLSPWAWTQWAYRWTPPPQAATEFSAGPPTRRTRRRTRCPDRRIRPAPRGTPGA